MLRVFLVASAVVFLAQSAVAAWSCHNMQSDSDSNTLFVGTNHADARFSFAAGPREVTNAKTYPAFAVSTSWDLVRATIAWRDSVSGAPGTNVPAIANMTVFAVDPDRRDGTPPVEVFSAEGDTGSLAWSGGPGVYFVEIEWIRGFANEFHYVVTECRQT